MDEPAVTAIASGAMQKIKVGSAILMGALMTAGCGGDSCLAPYGEYRCERVPVDDGCGFGPDVSVHNVDLTGGTGSGTVGTCAFEQVDSADGCEITRSLTCPQSSGNTNYLDLEISVGSSDGSDFTSIVTEEIYDDTGGFLCESTHRETCTYLGPPAP